MSKTKLVQLKVGDSVRVKYDKSVGSIISIFKHDNEVLGYYVTCGPRAVKFWLREDLRKIPKQSPASKLAAANNFWQGRVRSIQSQINSLARDNPLGTQAASDQLKLYGDLIKTQAYIVDKIVKERLQELKGKPNEPTDISSSDS